jgi:hypothetical protein
VLLDDLSAEGERQTLSAGVQAGMIAMYARLLRLYPLDLRILYGHEMMAGLSCALADARTRGRLAVLRCVARELGWLLVDAAAERVATWQSHPSFHGRCLPDPGVVRPPGVSKREWYRSES